MTEGTATADSLANNIEQGADHSKRSARIIELDVLRGVAVMLVLGHHMRPPTQAVSPFVRGFSEFWIQCGWIGVDLFFVLSGFLVSGLLFSEFLNHKRLDAVRFLIRRGFKIYPGFYALMLVTVIILMLPPFNSMQWLRDMGPRNIIAEALFVQNYFPGVWNHTWSLAVEEHFYILLAITLAISVKRSPNQRFAWIPGAFAAIAFIALVMRIVTFLVLRPTTLYAPTHLRIDALFFGVLLSYLYYFHRDHLAQQIKRWRRWIAVVSVGLIAPPFVWKMEGSFFLNTFGFSFLYLGFGGLLLLALHSRRQSHGRAIAAFAFIGFYSYAIYLWHMPVRRFLFLVFPGVSASTPQHVLGLIGYPAASIITGVILGRLIEIPALRLRDRLLPSKASAQDGPARANSTAKVRWSYVKTK